MSTDHQDFRTPGQLISALLSERGWTQRTLATVLGISESAVNRFVADKTPTDAKLALTLEEVFGVAADRFLDLQKNLDLAQARITVRPDPGRAIRAQLFTSLPISEMNKRGWIDAPDVRDVHRVESELMRFFGVNRPDDIEILPHAAKKTAVNSEPTPVQLAWLYRVRQISSEMIVGSYTETALRSAISKLRILTGSIEEARKVPRILTECGVRFVMVESLPSAKIDGVCFWLNKRAPVIGMSFRYDRIDNFWFVLRHECEHVLQGHGGGAAMLDAELEGERAGTGPNVPDEERIANLAAQNFCVPQKMMDAFIARKAPFFSEKDLLGFAKVVKTHPGIVAGQLQFRTGRYDRFRNYLGKVRAVVAPGAMKDGWGDVAPVGFQEGHPNR